MRLGFEVRVRRPGGFVLEAAHACEADAVGLVGPSGCGKTTLLNAIAGIEPGARVAIDGVDLSRLPLERRGVGYVSQEPLLFPHLTVRQNLLFSPRAEALGEVPDALGIGHLLDRMPRNLSGGERRRAALARAILSRPRVLLLDEPFAGLDEPRRREAMSLLVEVRRASGIPMILVSHLADEVVGLTEWSIRLERGTVAGAGPSLSILRFPETRIDNFLVGIVAGPDRVLADGLEVSVSLPAEAAGRVALACYGHEILLASVWPSGLSARNVFPVTVRTVHAAGEAAVAEVEPPRLRVLVTRESPESLGIRPGARVLAIVKATSILYLGRR